MVVGPRALRMLVGFGADLEKLGLDGCGPLHVASGHNQREVVELLLALRANKEATDLEGARVGKSLR